MKTKKEAESKCEVTRDGPNFSDVGGRIAAAQRCFRLFFFSSYLELAKAGLDDDVERVRPTSF